MRKHSLETNGVVVEKVEKEIQPIDKKKTDKPISISATNIIDTLQSYQISKFAENQQGEYGGICELCGAKTAYVNRHVCVDCWKDHKNDFIDCIKTAVDDLDFKIE